MRPRPQSGYQPLPPYIAAFPNNHTWIFVGEMLRIYPSHKLSPRGRENVQLTQQYSATTSRYQQLGYVMKIRDQSLRTQQYVILIRYNGHATKVTNSMPYSYDTTARPPRFLDKPGTLLQSTLHAAETGYRGTGLVSTSGKQDFMHVKRLERHNPNTRYNYFSTLQSINCRTVKMLTYRSDKQAHDPAQTGRAQRIIK